MRALCRQIPKVGAECLNWARSDLCGGRPAMDVPTANNRLVGLAQIAQSNAQIVVGRCIFQIALDDLHENFLGRLREQIVRRFENAWNWVWVEVLLVYLQAQQEVFLWIGDFARHI